MVNNLLTPGQQIRMLRNMKPLNELLHEWQATLGLTNAEAARRCKLSAQHWGLLLGGERADLRASTFNKLVGGTGIPKERLVLAASMLRDRKAEAPQPKPVGVTA